MHSIYVLTDIMGTKMRSQQGAHFLIVYRIHFIMSKTGICMSRIKPTRIQKYFMFIV